MTAPPPSCPLPEDNGPTVQLSHGGGGRMMQRLIHEIFHPAFDNPWLKAGHDGASLNMGDGRIALTTDSYVVHPLFFPGGDIGSLAVHGTVNDLAMCGALPKYLTAGFILEEGLPLEILHRVVVSMKKAADAAGVAIVTGDTKVVDRGTCDNLYINTAGVGQMIAASPIEPASIQDGDVVLVSGDVGRHGIAIMAVREGLTFDGAMDSDSAAVHHVVQELLEGGIRVHCLRDLTRGGLASALIELAEQSGYLIELCADAIMVEEQVQGACELLGFDPMYVANEGRFTAVVHPEDADEALAILQRHHPSAARIGDVADGQTGRVVLRSAIGTRRVLDLLSGEQLPRIC